MRFEVGSFASVLAAIAFLLAVIGLIAWLGMGIQGSRIALLFILAASLGIGACLKAKSRAERIFSAFLAAVLFSGLVAALLLHQ